MTLKTLVITLLFLFLLIPASFAAEDINQEQKKAIQSFEKLVDKFANFYKSGPKFLEKQSYSESPVGIAYWVNELHFQGISYDVKKTDSLVTPLMGYIDVKYTMRFNASCGNLGKEPMPFGWPNIEDALSHSDKESCFKWWGIKAYKPQSPMLTSGYVFAFQNEKWVFKDVLNRYDNKQDERLSALFGKPGLHNLVVTEKSGVLYNQKWLELIE